MVKKDDKSSFNTITTSGKIYERSNNITIKKLAKDIIDTQEREISIMKSLL